MSDAQGTSAATPGQGNGFATRNGGAAPRFSPAVTTAQEERESEVPAFFPKEATESKNKVVESKESEDRPADAVPTPPVAEPFQAPTPDFSPSVSPTLGAEGPGGSTSQTTPEAGGASLLTATTSMPGTSPIDVDTAQSVSSGDSAPSAGADGANTVATMATMQTTATDVHDDKERDALKVMQLGPSPGSTSQVDDYNLVAQFEAPTESAILEGELELESQLTSITEAVIRPETLLDESMVKVKLENFSELPRNVLLPFLGIAILLVSLAMLTCFPWVILNYDFPTDDDGGESIKMGVTVKKIVELKLLWWLDEQKFFEGLFSNSVYYKVFIGFNGQFTGFSMDSVFQNNDSARVLTSLDAQRFTVLGSTLFLLPLLLYLIYLRCYSNKDDRLDEAVLVVVLLALCVVFAAVELRYAMLWEASNLWNMFCDEFVEKFIRRVYDRPSETTEVNIYLVCSRSSFFAVGCALAWILFSSLAVLFTIDLVLLLKHVYQVEDRNCLEMTIWLQKSTSDGEISKGRSDGGDNHPSEKASDEAVKSFDSNYGEEAFRDNTTVTVPLSTAEGSGD